MSTLILSTKLFVPPKRSSAVHRAHLIGRLNSAVHGKLTLISAPAGFGKTTLVSEWLAETGYQHAWLSLDASDRDPSRFLHYVIAALQTVVPDIGSSLLERLQSPQALSAEVAVTTLINDLMSATGDPLILVLDDYHTLDSTGVDEIIAFLLDYQPPQFHLVMTTREDPPFSLARLRARGELTEIRIGDLRFSVEEATAFLNQRMGLDLSPDEVATLDARTEGWIAGLQMAALSMQGRHDTASFIESFTGSHRFILDYLIEEVLQRQPDHIREFLFQTSILDRLNASLCDRITGRNDSQEILETLERGNMLIFPLDDERQWYRYHHLFADVLLAHATQELPDQIALWQGDASHWYAENGFKIESVHYAFVAGDYERTADLLEMGWPAIFNGFQPVQWRGWVESLPEEMVRRRPVLSTGYAWTLLDDGIVDGVEARLQDAKHWLDTQDSADAPIVVNQREFASLPATIAGGYAYHALIVGDAPRTITHARHALDVVPSDDPYNHGIIAMFLGMGYWSNGELLPAYHALTESVQHLKLANHLHFQVVGTVMLADIQMALGQLRDAQRTYEQALDMARAQTYGTDRLPEDQSGLLIPGTINLYVGLAELYRRRGDQSTALDALDTGFALSQQTALNKSKYRLYITLARIQLAKGELGEALASLDEAQAEQPPGVTPDGQMLPALRARIWLLQGRLDDAFDWVQGRGLTPSDSITYRNEFEYFTLARVLIHLYRAHQDEDTLRDALQLIENLSTMASEANRIGSSIEALMLQALLIRAQGKTSNAVQIMEHTLMLAEDAGYVQIFADEGEAMARLLSECLSQGIQPDFVTHILQAIKQQIGDTMSVNDPNQLLIEPLTSRELDVLQLLAGGYTNQAIAEELVIALSTVKKHVNNIFGKLHVASRTQVINRARELKLI